MTLVCAGCVERTGGDAASSAADGRTAATSSPRRIDHGDGLVTEIFEQGDGKRVSSGSKVRLHYRAHEAGEGEPFDSTYATGVPIELVIGGGAGGRSIPGLDRGLIGLAEGCEARIGVPARFAWRDATPPSGVSKDSELVFWVRVVSVD